MLKTERMDRVRAALRAQGLTQMIVCDPKSVWYLTGVAVEPYERLLALYLPTEGEPVLFLNRLFNVPEPPCRTVWHTDTDKPVAQIAEVVDAGRPLGIDKEWPAKFLIPLMETHPGRSCCPATAWTTAAPARTPRSRPSCARRPASTTR